MRADRPARVALGRDAVDADTIRSVDVDPQLGAFAPGPRVATSDGGIVDADGDTNETPDGDSVERHPLAEEITEGAPYAHQS